jgi:hypothetical protein
VLPINCAYLFAGFLRVSHITSVPHITSKDYLNNRVFMGVCSGINQPGHNKVWRREKHSGQQKLVKLPCAGSRRYVGTCMHKQSDALLAGRAALCETLQVTIAKDRYSPLLCGRRRGDYKCKVTAS